MNARRVAGLATMAAAGAGVGAYLGLVTGAVPVDLGIGRSSRPLGPLSIEVAAPREVVFAVVRAPYEGRQSKAMQAKVKVLDRGTDMVLAAHYTPIRGSLRATTVETVRFTPPERVDFRLVRGPVPHVVESFRLQEIEDGTRLDYEGELGTDLWGAGRRWGDIVAARWLSAVEESLTAVKAESERRTTPRTSARAET